MNKYCKLCSYTNVGCHSTVKDKQQDNDSVPDCYKSKEIPKSYCLISNMFKDVNNPEQERKKYCVKNCRLKCLRGLKYKLFLTME